MPSVHLQTARAVGRDVDSMQKFHGDGFKVYELAAKRVQGKVLDIACGTGVGTLYLAEYAESVVGVDIDEEAVAYCAKRHKRNNLRFVQADATKTLPFKDKTFDTITTFETIEHLYPKQRKKYLAQLKRVLKDKGKILLSTPQNGITERRVPLRPIKHPYDHKIEFFYDELVAELEKTGFEIKNVGGIAFLPELQRGTSEPTKKFSLISQAQKITKFIPHVVKEKLIAPLLGYPFHIRNYTYLEKDLEKCKTFLFELTK